MAPKTDPSALEAQLAASPDDDAGYRVYADWLEEQGRARDALAMRVLGGVRDDSADGRDASRLAVEVARWLDPALEAHALMDLERLAPGQPACTPTEVRTARRAPGFLRLFTAAWGDASPFEVPGALVEALTHQPIAERLSRPARAKLAAVSFAHVEVNQNGTVGIDGAVLIAACDACTAFDVLAAELQGLTVSDVAGQDRAEAFDDAQDWQAVSRAAAWVNLVTTFRSNAGHGLKWGKRELDLDALLEELGPVRGGAYTQTEFTWVLTHFERGWLLLYVTF